jgi:hypothetical protein
MLFQSEPVAALTLCSRTNFFLEYRQNNETERQVQGRELGSAVATLAPFLSLRRGERWRRDAATEWGKAVKPLSVTAGTGRLHSLRRFGKVAI